MTVTTDRIRSEFRPDLLQRLQFTGTWDAPEIERLCYDALDALGEIHGRCGESDYGVHDMQCDDIEPILIGVIDLIRFNHLMITGEYPFMQRLAAARAEAELMIFESDARARATARRTITLLKPFLKQMVA